VFLAENGIKRADYFVLIAVLSWAEHENDHPEESAIKTKKETHPADSRLRMSYTGRSLPGRLDSQSFARYFNLFIDFRSH